MNRAQWLAERKKGIGGSDAGAVAGLNPYRSAFDIYMDKTDPEYEARDSEAMRQGRDLEEYVAARFCAETGKKVRRSGRIIRNPEYPYSFANVDRLVVGENAGLECKTANTYGRGRYTEEEYPPEYYCQCMHYMAVTGRKKWYLAVLFLGSGFRIYEIDRDEDEIGALMKAERIFWEEHILKGIPPEPAGSRNTDEYIIGKYPEECEEESVVLEGLGEELRRRDELGAMIKRMETEKRSIEQKIKLKMGKSAAGYAGERIISFRTQYRESRDINRIIEDFVPPGTDLSAYKKITGTRILRIK